MFYDNLTQNVRFTHVIFDTSYTVSIYKHFQNAEVFSRLNSVLEELRVEEFTWDEDINFLQTFIRDSQLQALADLNDHVAQSQSFEQPLGAVSPLCYEVNMPT